MRKTSSTNVESNVEESVDCRAGVIRTAIQPHSIYGSSHAWCTFNGSPHEALQLPIQLTLLVFLFMWQKGLAEQLWHPKRVIVACMSRALNSKQKGVMPVWQANVRGVVGQSTANVPVRLRSMKE